MFDVGFWELAIIGVVALVIVGPERLPGLARTVGLWVGKGRRMISEVKRDIDRELKASEMADLSSVKTEFDKVKKQVDNAKDSLVKDTGVDEAKSSLKETLDQASPLKQEIEQELDEIDQVAKQMTAELDEAKHTAETASDTEPPKEPISKPVKKAVDKQ